MKININKISSIFLGLFLVLPIVSLHGATATVVVNTLDGGVNAVEGVLVLPQNLNLSSIYTGKSAIVLWIERPFVNQNNEIVFSGITPGGFDGRQPLFSIEGDFDNNDLTSVDFKDLRFLRSDGSGLEVSAEIFVVEDVSVEDSLSPESLVVNLFKSEDLISGKYFVSFVGQDKESGISHYEYAYKFFGKPSKESWQKTSSPYQINNYALFSRIYIKAVDGFGNEKIITISGPYYYIHVAFWAIILVLILCLISYPRKFFPSLFSR